MIRDNDAGQDVHLSPGSIAALIKSSYEKIRPFIHKTQLLRDERLNLWLKCEHEQKTGSFKLRGAIAKLASIPPGSEIVTASTGNHGLAVAHAAEIFGHTPHVFLPLTASPKKKEKLKSSNAILHDVDGNSLDAELAAKKYANEKDLTWVSPYNDEWIISGQGTIGIELTDSISTISKMYITVGGGGLISGIASWIKSHDPGIEIIGCQPINSPEMYLSTLAGTVVNAPASPDTLSDGSAGPLEYDSITFPLCRQLVDRYILVDENEIAASIKYMWQQYGMIVEGAAGVALSAAITDEQRKKEESAIVILCGGNIDAKIHRNICAS